MERVIKIEFLEKEIKLEISNLTTCEIVKAITCLLESITTGSWEIVRKALSDAETKYKEQKND